jgi:hypothetical protein
MSHTLNIGRFGPLGSPFAMSRGGGFRGLGVLVGGVAGVLGIQGRHDQTRK